MGSRMHAARRAPAVGLVAFLVLAGGLAGCAGPGGEPGVVRLGYFPNLTHGQPLFGVESGLYQEVMGDVRLETVTFNAGPSAFEALNVGSVDVIYVGPSPTLNLLSRRIGDDIVVIAGSAIGGAAFVVRPGLRLEDAADLAGKTFATPQLGNTQDVALKHWLKGQGHRTTDVGGDVEVRYASNADILAMFQQGQLDGAWVPEPWATRLVLEADGVVHVRERDLWPEGEFITTQLVTTRTFLRLRPTEVAALLDAHVAATERLAVVDEAEQRTINDAIQGLTGKRLGNETLRQAVLNVRFSTDPLPDAMQTLAAWTRDIGFDSPSAERIAAAFQVAPLDAAVAKAGAP